MLHHLPHELLTPIINCAIESLDPIKRDRQLAICALVSKDWSGVASRLLLVSLKVRDGKHGKIMMKAIQEIGLETLVKNLEVVFQLGSNFAGYGEVEKPTAEDIEVENLVSLESFLSLVKILPRIQSLRLIRPSFIEFPTPDLSNLSILPDVTSLHFEPASYNSDLSIIRQLLVMAPKIVNLSITGFGELFADDRLDQCPPLDSLRISVISSMDYPIFSINRCLIPLSSFVGMKTLELKGYKTSAHSNVDDLIRIVSIAGTTLETFRVYSRFDYVDILSLLQLLPRVSTLSIQSSSIVPDDFFDHLPLSLHTLEGLVIYSRHLQHLRDNPRATQSVPIVFLEVGQLDEVFLALLPFSIITLDIGYILPEILLESIDKVGREGIPKGLREIVVFELDWIVGVSLALTADFEKYGISLK